jgi:hypothetical protein
MSKPINTSSLQQFLHTVKSADLTKQKEVKIDIETAKNMSYALGIVLARLAGDYEDLLSKKDSSSDEVIQVNMDGGTGWGS